MDLWRKEKAFVQSYTELPVTAPPPDSEVARKRAESEDFLSGGFDETSESAFYSQRAIIHRQWLSEAQNMKQIIPVNTPTSAPPLWRPNDYSKKCSVCDSRFGLILIRKHHCRRCGELVCSNCSPRYGPGVYLIDAPEDVNIQTLKDPSKQRICLKCEVKLKRDGTIS